MTIDFELDDIDIRVRLLMERPDSQLTFDAACAIDRLIDLVRSLRHRQWPEGASNNSAARDAFDRETDEMIAKCLRGNPPAE